MLFLLLALPEVLWNRRLTALSFHWSLGEPKLLSHISGRLSIQSGITMETWVWSQPHLSGSQAPWPMVASLLSCQEAQKACRLLPEEAKWACRGSRQLGIPPGFCHSQCAAQKSVNYSLGFWPMEKFSVRNFQPALLCGATAAPNEKGKMAQRFSHREGAGPWETWHYDRSAVLAATAQPRIHFQNVRYSLQN